MSRKRIIAIAAVSLSIFALIAWYTNSNKFVFRHLNARISNISHQNYIKNLSIEPNPHGPDTNILVTLVQGLDEEQIRTIALELVNSLDMNLYYGIDEVKARRVNPGTFTMFLLYTDGGEIHKYATCWRDIRIENGVPVNFDWSLSYASGVGEEFSTPYLHPLPKAWPYW